MLRLLLTPALILLALFGWSLTQPVEAQPYSPEIPKAARGAVLVGGNAFVQYYPPGRVWHDDNGEFLICPYGLQPQTEGPHPCPMTSRQDGWVLLKNYNPGGYKLFALQLVDGGTGPSLVLYWEPTQATLEAARQHH